MKIYLSGWQASNEERELKVCQSGWMKYRCFSFAMIQSIRGLPYYLPRLQGSYKACLDHKVGIMMDSGVISWRSYLLNRQKVKDQKAIAKLATEEEFIDQYVQYVRDNQKDWEIFMTIDIEKIPESVYQRHKRLLAKGIKPLPVFHGTGSTDWLQKYKDLGHDYIAVSSWRRTRNSSDRGYLATVFNKAAKIGIELHGLAFTSPWAILEFNWYSIDSSSWSRVAGFGGIMLWDAQRARLTNINVSDQETKAECLHKLSPRLLEAIKEQVRAEGFDFDELRVSMVQRHIYNARTMDLMIQEANRRHGRSEGRFNALF